ncbi:MAG TPA: glycosyltransferase 87 family protein [Myxococcaceae bacterium]|nr:glycosyltransferase 87 family protein [Myxococcaceae bacterium]
MVPLVPTLWAHAVGDLPVYFEATRAWLAGQTPYAEVRFEYPPYALLAFAPAALVSSTLREFQVAFGLELLLVDVAIRATLLWTARARRGAWAYAPFLAYAAVAQLQAFWLYKRFDLLPAGLTLAAVLALSAGAGARAGAALVAGIGMKVYPLMLLPLGLVHSARRGFLRRFIGGAALAGAPLAALGLIWPLFSAVGFHSARGLQVESLWASVLWLLRDWTGVSWVHAAASYEVQGGLAPAVLRVALVMWVIGAAAAVFLSVRPVDGPGPGAIAEQALLPLLALVSLGPVFSPQYVLWIATVTALLVEPGRWQIAVAPLAAAVLTRVTYPAPGYQSGLSPVLTSVLVLRNLLLVGGLGWLMTRGSATRTAAAVRTGGTGQQPP